MTDATIFKRLQEHYEYVRSQIPKDYTIFFTALQGSQNYGLDDENSDIDTKTLVIPSFRDHALNKKPISTTLIMPDSQEHADVKDFRLMFECFKKQNVNFLEILFTPHFIVNLNPRLIHLHNLLVEERERIAHYNPWRAICTMTGMIHEKYYAFDHPYPAAKEKLEKYGYDPKQLCHMLRMHEFITRYIDCNEPFESCLKPRDPEKLLFIKHGGLSLQEACKLRAEIEMEANELKMTWMEYYLPIPCDKYIDEFLDDISLSLFRTCYRDEFLPSSPKIAK